MTTQQMQAVYWRMPAKYRKVSNLPTLNDMQDSIDDYILSGNSNEIGKLLDGSTEFKIDEVHVNGELVPAGAWDKEYK